VGTDATFMVEVKSGDKWTPVLAPIWPDQHRKEQGRGPFGIAPVIERHYGLYSLLADIRNRTGRGRVSLLKQEFEGQMIEFVYDTDDGGHEPITPIAGPRGVPEDANNAWKKYCAEPWTHDPTWVTLNDIQEADWDQTLQEQAVIREEDYLHWRETGEMPEMRPRGVGGSGVRVVTVEEYEAGERGESTAIDFHWVGEVLRDDVPKAWWATVAVMSLVAPHGDPEKVRLLVAFDS
jgi:hypothetical protein